MRFVELVALSMYIIGAAYLVSMLLMVFGVIFHGLFPIDVDFTTPSNIAVIAFAAVIIFFCIMVLIRYVPNIVTEGEEL